MVSEGRLCCWTPCLVCGVPPSVCWRPPSVCSVVPLNGGVWCVVVLSPCLVLSPVLFAVFPVFVLDPASRIVRSLLRCILSCRAVYFFFVLLCRVQRTGGWYVWCHCECCISFPLPSVFVFAVTALLV